ncbi:MAG: hypothetical protein JXA77_10265 [Bacteroidales bacterium]|nr:hypothetical protein [Bacteroidales bacterium]
MNKTSTLFFSIHNLGSNTYHQISDTDDLNGEKEFSDVYNVLKKGLAPIDVRQEIVDNLLAIADKIA